MSKLKIYLSASISHALSNQYIADLFPKDQYHVYLPQNIVPDELNHTQFPLHVYQQCIDMMESSDIGLVLLDAFGRDCAWECGWYSARQDKCLIAFVQSSSLFLRDWMVKGGLDAWVTTNERLHQAAQANPLLSQKSIALIDNDHALPEAITAGYQTFKSR